MSVKKQIILIPFWVKEILERNQLPLATCLDLEKLKPLMSLNDLVTFATLQGYSKKVMGVEFLNELVWVWSRGIVDTNTAMKDFLWKTIVTLEKDASFRTEVETRLFDIDAKTDHHKDAFITYDITSDVMGVVIYPGFFVGEGVSEFQKPVVQAILKLLYVYEPTHEVAKTPLFKRYLELLTVE